MDYPQQHIKPYDEEGKKTEQVERCSTTSHMPTTS